MANLPVEVSNHVALKDWAVTISALLEGDQIMLLRKGESSRKPGIFN